MPPSLPLLYTHSSIVVYAFIIVMNIFYTLIVALVLSALYSATTAAPSALEAIPLSLRGRLSTYGHPLHHNVRVSSEMKDNYGVRVSPLDHGGDPLGIQDSSASLDACIAVCANYSRVIDSLGHFPGDASFGDGKYIANAGGCQVDLGGGEFKLSRPLKIPPFLGNLSLKSGSFIADVSFPSDSFLVVVGEKGSCNYPQGSCNVAINMSELFFDGRHLASALQINNVMGMTIENSYFLNFTSFGIQINDGHEAMIQHCWLGETNFDYPFTNTNLPTSIAIQINGNDHYVRDTIVFSSKIGVQVNGAANYISGTHVWFPMNRALQFVGIGVMAFHITQGQNRFDGCYIDGSRAVFEGRGLMNNLWTNGFECCAGDGLSMIPHGIELWGNTVGPGLIIKNNQFMGGSIFSSATGAVTVSGIRIHDNAFGSSARATVATLMLSDSNRSQWVFDFCDKLVFRQIASVSVSVQASSGFPIAVVRSVVECTVKVETSEAMTGIVTVAVDSSTPSSDFL